MEQIIPKEARVSRELSLVGLEGPLDLEALFGNRQPLELEIGIGKGYFIQHAASSNPDRNYIGIEWARKYLKQALERIEKRALPNVRLVCGEAFSFIEQHLPPASLHALHIYFPDPWPKKKHHKRRLFSPEFLRLVHERLVPGGLLLIATDHLGYWEHMCEVLDNQTLLERCEQLPETPQGADGLTNYEMKYLKEGRPIYRTGYRKPL